MLEWLNREIQKDNVLYINKNKASSMVKPSQANSVWDLHNNIENALSKISIPTEEDLDKLKSVNSTMYQKNASQAKGQTTAYQDGKRIVELFAGADESTFLHEMGHIFLMDPIRWSQKLPLYDYSRGTTNSAGTTERCICWLVDGRRKKVLL